MFAPLINFLSLAIHPQFSVLHSSIILVHKPNKIIICLMKELF